MHQIRQPTIVLSRIERSEMKPVELPPESPIVAYFEGCWGPDGQMINHRLNSDGVGNEKQLAILRRLVRLEGIDRIYSPVPGDSTKLVTEHDFDEGRAIALLPQTEPGGAKKRQCRIFNGVSADAFEHLPSYPERWAWRLGSADCPGVIACDPVTRLTVRAHAGRKNVLHRESIEVGDRDYSKHPSIVSTMFSAMEQELGGRHALARVQVYLFGGIGPDNFEHPVNHQEFGEYNQKMIPYVVNRFGRDVIAGPINEGRIDMVKLIRRHCLEFGVHDVRHDGVDTYNDRDKSGRYKYWSHKRYISDKALWDTLSKDEQKFIKEPVDGRNLLLVYTKPRT